MADDFPPDNSSRDSSFSNDGPQRGVVRSSRGLPLVWLLPLIAALIAVWLLYRDVTEGDIKATILFHSGDGLVAGKTVVKYSGVDIGVVRDFRLAPKAPELDGADGVLAEVDFNRSAEHLLVAGTDFWVVKPEFSITGVRGLETLVSGNYIAVEPGSGGRKRKFVALDRPPAFVRGDGLRVVLKSARLGSLNRGSPVYYRQLRVGQVEDYHLDQDDSEVEIDLFIRREFAHLVHRGSRFWNSSGISVEGGIGGLTVNLESLAALVAGGVSFHTPEAQQQSPLAVNGTEFKLYNSFAAADAGISVTLNFDRGVNVTPGSTLVYYQGIQVGKVSAVKASRNIDGMEVRLLMDPITDDLLSENTIFWLAPPTLDFAGGLNDLLKGNRIEVDLRRGQRSLRTFQARSSAPPMDPRAPGLHLRLTARNPGSLQRGASVYYRRIEVGKVQGMELRKGGDGVEVYVVIEPRYANLVNDESRFWNISGLRATASLNGIEVEADSLLSMVRGGIAFGSPPRARENAAAAKNGDRFPLYSSREAALEEGVAIQIRLPDAEGLKEGAPLRYRGIQVGEITRMRLEPDLGSVRATAKLFHRGEHFARDGTRIWVVSPQIGISKVANLDTLITGRYLALEPGGGALQTEFTALPEPPREDLAETMSRPGLAVILDASRRGSLVAGSPVYYRQVQVGEVTGFALGELADRVYIYVHIEPCYRALVREHTVFWNASGVEVNFGLKTGLQINTESTQALLAGGVAFATPEPPQMGLEVESGSHYPLYPESQPEWFTWSPKIEICGAVEPAK
ncbi:Paraquat-inducible protein B [Microbulbifer donghaiensis]|uniref:Paraquat-inducible protein B n=1 Tax=Microbulbifer donghaiensis TaxID=494016 RepID=A0A1M5F8L2_9GAMM|nr:MlaD family protein [Microbulbifer donghaiensis]SHF87894.1 Paraquat-inducible protein B [Microbulbifer donghaiensis]